MEVVQITAEQTLPLRNDVLRPGMPLSSCFFDGDEAARTRHFGTLDEQGAVAGVVSIYCKPHPELPTSYAYQLRGMATADRYRGQGIGVRLLEEVHRYLAAIECAGLWANARTEALGFYKKQGYQVMSDEFVIENVGPHYLVAKSFLVSGKSAN
jgi:GNAT superfamily N-acetyltransferase